MKLEEFLKKQYNYNPETKDQLKSYIKQWRGWYEGDVKSFHNYFIYNGNRKVSKKRFSLNMAKEISEDWADLLWSEKCSISMKDEKGQENIEKLINELDLYSIFNQVIEKAGALGTAATVIGVYNLKSSEDGMTLDVSEAKTRIEIVNIDWIFPLTWNNKEVTECAFGSVEYINGDKYIVLSVHKKNEQGNYVIHNHLFKETNGAISEVQENENTLKEFDTKSDVKWFSIFKPLITNNLFENSPFGIPYYANAIDCLKAVDISFDALKNEIIDGKKRTFVRADMFNYDNGEQKLVFDPNDTTVYQLPSGATKEDLIQSDSDTLRTSQQIETLNTNLNILGSKVGFGENHYHFDGTNLSTATAVVSSNSKLFRRKKKLEIGYESSIYDAIKGICYASSKFGTYKINSEDLSVKFDDSIIEDKEAESMRARSEVSAGLLSKVEYRMKVYGETEEIAKQKIKEINDENPDVKTLLGTKDNSKDDEE